MKNTKALKIFSIILSVALLVIGAVATTVSAEEAADTPKVEIVSKNLSYTSEIAIMFAVRAENVGEAEVTLNVYDEDPLVNSSVTVKQSVPVSYTEDINDYGNCLVYITEGIPAKAIEREIYAQAVVTVDGNTYKSSVERYSIVEYCHEMNAKKDTDLYTNIITYGATIQQMLKDDGKFSGAYATDYKYVTIEGGTLDGNYDSGIYLKDETVTPYISGAAKLVTDAGEVVDNNVEYTVGNTNVSFSVADTKALATETFEEATTNELPSNITFSDTIPSVPDFTTYDRCSYLVGNFTSGYNTIDGNDTKVLFTSNTYQATQAAIKISESANAQENANVVEFETDICLDWSLSSSSKEFCNILLTDADGNVAFNFTLKNGAQNQNKIAINHRNSSGTQKSQIGQTLPQTDAYAGKWFNLRITYKYVSETQVEVKVYINGTALSGTATSPFNEADAISVSEIANVYVCSNCRGNHSISNKLAIDNVVFRKIAE